MLLKITALSICILLSLPIASKLFARIVWFLFPYSSLALSLRSTVAAIIIARSLSAENSELLYTDRLGRTCVNVYHSVHGGFDFEDIGYVTEELFSRLAERLAPQMGYTRSFTVTHDDRTVFQFWNDR